jgi:hypothetical protein
MATCKHGLESGCADCNPSLPAVSPYYEPDAQPGPWFEARFSSDCHGCGGDITEGDYIRSDGAGGWLCGICGHEGEEPAVAFCPVPVSGTAETEAYGLAAFLDQYREGS